MVPHLRPHLLSGKVEDDQVGFLPGHVAINAVGSDWVIRFCKGRGVWFVAAQAPLRELSQIVLRGMNIMACEAGHGRFPEATALLEHVDLVAMDIQRRIGIGRRKMNVLVQRIAGKVRKRRQQSLTVAGVAPGAEIHLPVARESCRVQDGRGGRRLGFLLFDMFSSRAVTFFALDAEGKGGGAVTIG